MSNCRNDIINKPRMSILESVIFVFIFILPFFFFATSPEGTADRVLYMSFAAYMLLFAFKKKYLLKVFYSKTVIIVLLYILGLSIKYFVHGSFSMMSFLMPIVGIYGYYYIDSKNIRLVVFDVLLIGLYAFFVYSFFTNLSGFLIREKAEAEGEFFGISSSNAISIILVNVLYIYQVIAYLQKENRQWRLFLFSVINLALILVQQSRAGIILALLFFCYNLFLVGRRSKIKVIRVLPFVIIGGILVWGVRNASFVYEYLDQIDAIDSSYSDSRGFYVQLFFERMDSIEYFIAGYPQGLSWGEETYTFNIFLEQWNKYTIVGLCVTLFLLIRRFTSYKSFYFPWYYSLPFILYGMVEPRYLPNFWDFFIYLLLLKKAEPKAKRYISIINEKNGYKGYYLFNNSY